MTQLRRSSDKRLVAGVCQGLADYLHVDPLVVRIVAVILALMNGVGVVLYLLGWLLLPAAKVQYQGAEDVIRHNAEEIGQRARDLVSHGRAQTRSADEADPWDRGDRRRQPALLGGMVLVGIGLFVLMRNLGLFSLLSLMRLLPLALIAIGVLVLYNTLREA